MTVSKYCSARLTRSSVCRLSHIIEKPEMSTNVTVSTFDTIEFADEVTPIIISSFTTSFGMYFEKRRMDDAMSLNPRCSSAISVKTCFCADSSLSSSPLRQSKFSSVTSLICFTITSIGRKNQTYVKVPVRAVQARLATQNMIMVKMMSALFSGGGLCLQPSRVHAQTLHVHDDVGGGVVFLAPKLQLLEPGRVHGLKGADNRRVEVAVQSHGVDRHVDVDARDRLSGVRFALGDPLPLGGRRCC